MSEVIDLSILLEEYLDDASGHLDSVETALLALEKSSNSGGSDPQSLISILGNLHTLKGNSGMMGFTPVQQYIHRLESVLKMVQEQEEPLSAAVFEAFYTAVSSLR
ncbi:MAG: CheA signal transduction histidine kinase, partial [Deltaproteobacteria bacterium]|nr:CheA signal transduction histidine kinase [Deltaproteobacteria bacterium]